MVLRNTDKDMCFGPKYTLVDKKTKSLHITLKLLFAVSSQNDKIWLNHIFQFLELETVISVLPIQRPPLASFDTFWHQPPHIGLTIISVNALSFVYPTYGIFVFLYPMTIVIIFATQVFEMSTST